jgi:hypothetical protein
MGEWVNGLHGQMADRYISVWMYKQNWTRRIHAVNTVTYTGQAWLITTGSGSDYLVYWHFFTISVDCNSPHIELLLNDVCLANAVRRISNCCLNLGLVSISSLWTLSLWFHKSTAFYNLHAVRMEDITLSSSSAVLVVATGILCLALITR